MTAMQTRVDVIEEVPHMPDHNATDLILGHNLVHDQAEGHEHPWKVGSREDQQAQEAEASLGVAAGPDVDQAGRECSAEEREGEKGRDDQQGRHGVEDQPGELRRRSARGLLEETRVSLQEEDMEQEVEIQRAEIKERGQQAPVLGFRVDCAEAVEELEWSHDVALHQHRCGHGGYRPPARDGGHFIEPLLEWELTHLPVVLP